MITTLFLHPLGPSLVLALGGLLLMLLRHRGRPTAASPGRWSLPAAFVFLLLAGSALLALRLGRGGHSVVQWSWQPLTVGGSTLTWRLDGWNWLAALLILFALMVALAVQGDPAAEAAGPARARRTLWLGAAALAFVFADNLVTLACCWVFLDAALLLRLLPGEAEQPAGRAWGVLSLGGLVVLAALVFQGESNARAALIGGAFGRPVLVLLWLAGLIRAGAYPLHFWLTGTHDLEPGDRVALHLVGPIAGIWLLGRVHLLAGPGWLHRPEWAGLGALALLGTALAAWAAPDGSTAWRWVAINRASLVVLTAYVAGSAGPPALVWPLVTFALGVGLLALGQAVYARWGWRLPLWLGALAVWGLPGTPGFLARWVLVWPTDLAQGAVRGTPAGLPFGLLLFLLILVSEILLVASLWEMATGPAVAAEGAREPSWAGPAVVRLGAATVMLAVPVLLWGLAPRQPIALAGLTASGLPLTLAQAIGEARRSVWAGLVVTGAAGAALGWLRPQIFTGMRGWQEGILSFVGLEWLYQAAGMVLALLGALLQYFARLGEGEGYLGWLALAGLILWVLLRS